jgi:ubiquinone/menaquinone biosynthesis C-methylase UbiE
MMKRFKKKLKSILTKTDFQSRSYENNDPKQYWTEHNVTSHHEFFTVEESLDFFHWRNDQYFNYIELMPVSGFDGKSVLDYGCGPGHDLIGFGTYSSCKSLVGVDVSSSSVTQTRARLALHGIQAETVLLERGFISLPFADATFDHIHSSGVLHHTQDPVAILTELNRVLKPGGSMNVMVYNYNSLWTHLYVAYQRSIVEGLYPGKNLRDQFTHSTDGENCPISNCYRPDEWEVLCESAGFNAKFIGAAISMHEASLLPLRFAAIQDRRLPAECRNFLLKLKFDDRGYPLFNGHYAGVDACYRLAKAA